MSRPSAASAWTTPSAVPIWPQASGPVLQWVSSCSGRPSGAGRRSAPRRARAAWSIVASRDDRLRLVAKGRRDCRSVVEQLPHRGIAGQHPVRRPADRHRRRARVDEGVRRAAQDRSPGVRLGLRRPSGGKGQADRRHLAEGRGAADDHVPDRLRHVAGRLAADLDELVGQAPLVEEHEPVVDEAERAAEAGRGRRGGRAGHRGRSVGEEVVRHLLRRLADRARGPDERSPRSAPRRRRSRGRSGAAPGGSPRRGRTTAAGRRAGRRRSCGRRTRRGRPAAQYRMTAETACSASRSRPLRNDELDEEREADDLAPEALARARPSRGRCRPWRGGRRR